MWFVKGPFPPYFQAVSCVLCNFYWDLFAIFGCVEVCRVVSVFVLLSTPPLYWSLFMFGKNLFSFEFGGCCWLLWLNSSFNISGECFSKVGQNLPHSNCIGSLWNFYLLLICIALVLTWIFSSLYAFLMLAGFAKLMPPIQLLSAILPLLKYPASASLFWVWYMQCAISPEFAGPICVRLLQFSVICNCIKLFELLDILGLLLLWLNTKSWSPLEATKLCPLGYIEIQYTCPLFFVLEGDYTHIDGCITQNGSSK